MARHFRLFFDFFLALKTWNIFHEKLPLVVGKNVNIFERRKKVVSFFCRLLPNQLPVWINCSFRHWRASGNHRFSGQIAERLCGSWPLIQFTGMQIIVVIIFLSANYLSRSELASHDLLSILFSLPLKVVLNNDLYLSLSNYCSRSNLLQAVLWIRRLLEKTRPRIY